MLTLDLSLSNKALYNGCEIEEAAGRLNLKTPPAIATNIIGKNAQQIVNENSGTEREVCLTGAMSIWAYLVVFHIVVHRFAKVWYDDGRGNKILVAAHG